MTDTTDVNAVSNRSEIVFLYDAIDTNPNGNPLSDENRPRIDPETQQCIVTDVRLKRYIRDQMSVDGHPVYIKSERQEDGSSPTREWLVEQVIESRNPESVTPDILNEFLENAVDVRMFGSTFSISARDDKDEFIQKLKEVLPHHVTGPVQFTPGKTIHPVNENENYEALTSVIGTDEGKEQGGYQLSDHRIQYGMIRFGGVVDPNRAKISRLTPTDVQRLDQICWRSIKEQTTTRNKVGQNPQLYIRVEYNDDATYLGNVGSTITPDTELMEKPINEVRKTNELILDMDRFITRLSDAEQRINTVHVKAGGLVNISYNGNSGTRDKLYNALRETLGESKLNVIDVNETAAETAPSTE